jgi:hypothetical protein
MVAVVAVTTTGGDTSFIRAFLRRRYRGLFESLWISF